MEGKTQVPPASTNKKPEKSGNYPFDWGGKPSRQNRTYKKKWGRK